MKKSVKPAVSKPLVAAVIIAFAVCSILIAKVVLWNKGGVQKSSEVRTIGKPNAKVHIVEYLDFQCPACAFGAKQIHKYLETYPDQIYLEVKYFPLGGHQHSMEAAKFAECSARQDKFWPFFNTVLERQEQWASLFDAHPAFMQIIDEIQADKGRIKSCIQEDAVREEILAEKAVGAAKGIQSTPTYFINGKMFVGAKLMAAEVERLLGVSSSVEQAK